MTRFHFHLHECGTVLEDEDGAELLNVEAARARAVSEAREIMSSEVRQGALCLGCCIVVTDTAGAEVLRVPFREAVVITGG